jgi:exopolysaccharide production protein ExoZ
VLRAVAALGVVLYHVQHMLFNTAADGQDTVSKLGATGVDLFFVISGFLMMYVSYNRFRQPGSTRDFVKSRIIRIVPAYYVFTTLTVGILLLAPQLYGQLRFTASQTIFSYLFVLSRNNVGEIGTVVGVGWTLAFEAFFYVIFAILLRLPRAWCIPALSIFFAAGFVVGQVWHINAAWATVLISPLTFEFLFGCIIGLLFRRGLTLAPWICWVAVAGGVGGLVVASSFGLVPNDLSPIRPLIFGIPAALIVVGAVFFERTVARSSIPRLLGNIGDSSYSLYLSHQYVLAAIVAVIVPRVPKGSILFWAVAALAVVLCLLFGSLFYRYFEHPTTERLRALWMRKPIRDGTAQLTAVPSDLPR